MDGAYAENGMVETPEFNNFSDKSVRLKFIRKVYGIISVQMVVTMGFVFAFALIPSVQQFALQNSWIFFIALAGALISLITIACCGVGRSFPANLVCLGIFTVSESLMMGFVAASTNGTILIQAIIVTTLIVLGLTLFAFQTKIDFTVYSGILFVVLIVFFVFGFIAIFFPASRTVNLIYSAFGTLLFSCFLVIDTQMIIGGSHSRQFSPEDYVIASINIYLDILNLFFHILQFLQMTQNRN